MTAPANVKRESVRSMGAKQYWPRCTNIPNRPWVLEVVPFKADIRDSEWFRPGQPDESTGKWPAARFDTANKAIKYARKFGIRLALPKRRMARCAV